MIEFFIFIFVICIVISSSKKKNQGNMRNTYTPPGSPLPNANVTRTNPYTATQNPQMAKTTPYAAKPNPQMTGTNPYTSPQNPQTAKTNTYSPHPGVQSNNTAYNAAPVNRPKDFSEYPSFTETGVPAQPVRRQPQPTPGKNASSATVSKRTQPQTKKLNKKPVSENMAVTPVPAEAEPVRPALAQPVAFVDFYQPQINFNLSSVNMEGTLYIPNEPSGLLMGISEYNSEFGGI